MCIKENMNKRKNLHFLSISQVISFIESNTYAGDAAFLSIALHCNFSSVTFDVTFREVQQLKVTQRSRGKKTNNDVNAKNSPHAFRNKISQIQTSNFQTGLTAS